MADLTLPDYHKGKIINSDELLGWKDGDFLKGYLIVNASFKFAKGVKYPSIPCYIDKNSTVYPLEGTGLLTGPEYLLAKKQGCEIEIKSAFYIPPKENTILKNKKKQEVLKISGASTIDNNYNNITHDEEVEYIKPFHTIIKEIQRLRREHSKGTINNLLYKEMGNSIYGNVVRGMSNKKSFDTLTGEMVRVKATELSNPILAS